MALVRYVTFHEQQECGYGFPSLPLATSVSADVLSLVLKKHSDTPAVHVQHLILVLFDTSHVAFSSKTFYLVGFDFRLS